jgi:protein ImuB
MYGCLHSPRSLPEGLLLELARDFTPRVEAESPLTVLLDLRGLGRMWPSPEALGQALQQAGRDRGHDLQVALAGTRTASLLLGRSRPGLTVVPLGQEAAALSPLPLGALGLPLEREELFRRWGLPTLGALAALPALGLAERLGPDGPRLRRQAQGEDEVPLVATPTPESFDCTLEVDWPVDGLEPLAFLLARVLEPLGQTLVSRCRRAAALTLELALVDGRTHRRTLRPSAPSAEPRTWRTLLLLDLETHPPGDAVLALTVRAEPTPARAVQFSLLDPAQPSPERLAETMARLTEWTAEGRGGAPALLDSHRPGAFVMETFAPGPFRATSGERTVPPRLALRAFRPPRPAEVTLRAGEPAFVSAPGARGAVSERAGPWRASGDWWDVAWSREEWDVALQDGGVYRIYHDRLREAWFVEGELD